MSTHVAKIVHAKPFVFRNGMRSPLPVLFWETSLIFTKPLVFAHNEPQRCCNNESPHVVACRWCCDQRRRGGRQRSWWRIDILEAVSGAEKSLREWCRCPEEKFEAALQAHLECPLYVHLSVFLSYAPFARDFIIRSRWFRATTTPNRMTSIQPCTTRSDHIGKLGAKRSGTSPSHSSFCILKLLVDFLGSKHSTIHWRVAETPGI